MKEDYLWDKTGGDPEIERLENALRAFRYTETALPALPAAKVVLLKKEPFYKAFRFPLAAAACLAFGVLAFGVWFQVLRNNIEGNGQLAGINNSQSEARLPDPGPPPPARETAQGDGPEESPNTKVRNLKGSPERKNIRIRKEIPAAVRQRDLKAQRIKNVAPEVQLTKEERYAYNQLMLALSITSSKLKLVKDKVEGLDEKNAVLKNGQ